MKPSPIANVCKPRSARSSTASSSSQTTSTESSQRTIALTQATVAALKTHRAAQHAARLAAGPAWNETGYVFTRPDGHPWHPAHVSAAFLDLAEAAGLPPISFRDLRHGAATLHLAAGTDMKIVQELLGHSTIVLTADTYTSVLSDVARTAAENAAALIPHTPPRPLTSTGDRPRTKEHI